jgi:hypothetical protein
VIRRHDHQVSAFEKLGKARQHRVERFQCRGIARHIPAMPVQHVEIDEIGEHQVSVLSILSGLQRRFEERRVAARLAHIGDALMGKDIADLADREHAVAALADLVQQSRSRRRNRKVAPVAGPVETRLDRPDERPRDHPADIQRIDQLAHDLAELDQPLQAESLLVGGNLEHRIR